MAVSLTESVTRYTLMANSTVLASTRRTAQNDASYLGLFVPDGLAFLMGKFSKKKGRVRPYNGNCRPEL